MIFFFSCYRPKPCLYLSFCVNGNALILIWSCATLGKLQIYTVIYHHTKTYNFNVTSRDSYPSFGARDKPLGLDKSPDKANLKEELIAVSFRGDESHFTLHLVHSIRWSRQTFFFFFFSVQASCNICVYLFLSSSVCYDLLFFTFQQVITQTNGVSLITVAAVWILGFCLLCDN